MCDHYKMGHCFIFFNLLFFSIMALFDAIRLRTPRFKKTTRKLRCDGRMKSGNGDVTDEREGREGIG
jgi:hypothetical protein